MASVFETLARAEARIDRTAAVNADDQDTRNQPVRRAASMTSASDPMAPIATEYSSIWRARSCANSGR